jgi:hypothetical protein
MLKITIEQYKHTLVFLGLVDHTLDFLRQATIIIGDSDTIRLAGSLVRSGDVQDTVCIDVEGDLNLRNTTGSGGYQRDRTC